MSKRLFIGAGIIGLAALTEVVMARYLLERVLIRKNVKTERTQKMSGTNWDNYIPFIKERKAWLMLQEREDVYITSDDGLRLHGVLVPNENSKKVVICFHGYSSKGATSDFAAISKFYKENDFNILMVDARAHGESDGKYIGFGCLDRMDVLKWINYVVEKFGEECQILLHGISMGGATVVMASGLHLPNNVKFIISDCAFTSPWEVFSYVLKNMYNIPPFQVINIASNMCKKMAGYNFKECNADIEVRRATVPILFIHGANDTFVPCRMCHDIYDNCHSDKEILIVKEAGHAESYYKETEIYEENIKKFISKYILDEIGAGNNDKRKRY